MSSKIPIYYYENISSEAVSLGDPSRRQCQKIEGLVADDMIPEKFSPIYGHLVMIQSSLVNRGQSFLKY